MTKIDRTTFDGQSVEVTLNEGTRRVAAYKNRSGAIVTRKGQIEVRRRIDTDREPAQLVLNSDGFEYYEAERQRSWMTVYYTYFA